MPHTTSKPPRVFYLYARTAKVLSFWIKFRTMLTSWGLKSCRGNVCPGISITITWGSTGITWQLSSSWTVLPWNSSISDPKYWKQGNDSREEAVVIYADKRKPALWINGITTEFLKTHQNLFETYWTLNTKNIPREMLANWYRNWWRLAFQLLYCLGLQLPFHCHLLPRPLLTSTYKIPCRNQSAKTKKNWRLTETHSIFPGYSLSRRSNFPLCHLMKNNSLAVTAKSLFYRKGRKRAVYFWKAKEPFFLEENNKRSLSGQIFTTVVLPHLSSQFWKHK